MINDLVCHIFMKFNYQQDFSSINFRLHPELYQIGKGEQGVLLVEPYKSEILPYWRFKTAEIARESSEKIYELFLYYKSEGDFIGMDMARKFLQMGFTRARRYANHSSGKKYKTNPQKELTIDEQKQAREKILPQNKDWDTNEKSQAAEIFYKKYLLAKNDSLYQQLKKNHLQLSLK